MNRLHYFCTVVQTGALTKASELLHLSQPALSKAIKTLEAELGHKLIIPSGRGIAITDYGHKLAKEAAPLLKKMEDLKSLDRIHPKPNTVSIATFEVFSTYFLSQVVEKDFRENEVKILELVPGPMEEAIVTRRADIGITYLPVPHPELDILKVTSIEMGIFGNKQLLNTKDPLGLPFVAPTTPIMGTPSKALGLDGWPDHKLPRNIQYQVTMMETGLGLCRRGLCVGYFPRFVVDLHNLEVKNEMKLSKFPNPAGLNHTKYDVFMMKRKSDMESTNFKKISRALRALGN